VAHNLVTKKRPTNWHGTARINRQYPFCRQGAGYNRQWRAAVAPLIRISWRAPSRPCSRRIRFFFLAYDGLRVSGSQIKRPFQRHKFRTPNSGISTANAGWPGCLVDPNRLALPDLRHRRCWVGPRGTGETPPSEFINGAYQHIKRSIGRGDGIKPPRQHRYRASLVKPKRVHRASIQSTPPSHKLFGAGNLGAPWGADDLPHSIVQFAGDGAETLAIGSQICIFRGMDVDCHLRT